MTPDDLKRAGVRVRAHPLDRKYEPESRNVQTPIEAAIMSIAISLKRIADHLETDHAAPDTVRRAEKALEPIHE